MIVDNFDRIRKHLRFDADNDSDWFYHVQIIIRRKDEGTTIKKNCKTVRSYYVRSLQYYDDHIEQIKDMCRMFHARAYIRLNPSSWKKCVLMAFGELATYLRSNQCSSLRKLTDELAGKYNADGIEKTWIIDIDTKDKGVLADAVNIADRCLPVGHKIIDCIPTKNGYHLISKPFNLQQFKETWEEESVEVVPDIHKNNPTLLYYEDNDAQ